MKKCSVIGIGRLGLCWSLNLERKGWNILGVDIDEKYDKSLNDKSFTSKEPLVDNYLKSSNNFKASTDISKAVNHSNILYIVVPTNTLESGHYDHSIIDNILDSLISLGKQQEEKHIILQSTTIPGYCDGIEKKLSDCNYTLTYNPEFIRQGSIIEDQQSPDMVLIGTTSTAATSLLLEAYGDMCKNKPNYNIMDNISAEITKLSLNCFLTTKISFTNMIGDLAKSVGANPDKILNAIGSDSRIGNKLMKYGFGYGGTCLPRDNRALAVFAKEKNMPIDISIATDEINKKHLDFQVSEFKNLNPNMENSITFTQVSFKPGSDIIEESQKLKYAVKLAKLGYSITIEDTIDVISAVKKQNGNLFKYKEI